MAQTTIDKEETSGRVSLREPEKGATQNAPRQPGQWVAISTPTTAKHGTEYFVVGGVTAGAFSQLRIDATWGTMKLRKVRVLFSDGTAKTFPVARTLSENGKKYAIVDLGTTKPIDQVIVTTEAKAGGKYAIYGSSGASGAGVVSSR